MAKDAAVDRLRGRRTRNHTNGRVLKPTEMTGGEHTNWRQKGNRQLAVQGLHVGSISFLSVGRARRCRAGKDSDDGITPFRSGEEVRWTKMIFWQEIRRYRPMPYASLCQASM
jgi:hypothetical protein